VPELAISVAPNPNRKDEIPLGEEAAAGEAVEPDTHPWLDRLRRDWPWAAGALAAVLLAARVVAVRRRKRRAAGGAPLAGPTERELFRLLRASKDDARATLAATYRWLDRREESSAAARLDAFAARSGDTELVAQSSALEDTVCEAAGGGAWSRPRFLAAVSRARDRRPRAAVVPPLPPLNPPESALALSSAADAGPGDTR
jgi:hypothetical protein